MFVHVRRVSINRTLIAGLFIAATVGSYQAQSAGSFSPADSMAGARASVPAILLQDGRVLLAGQDASSSASEVYDPATGSFTPTGSLNQARSSAGAVRLDDGRVLVVGGWDGAAATASVELYDAASGTFSSAGNMLVPRMDPAVERLRDGRVLIAGGHDGSTAYTSAELYDPASGTFTATGSMRIARVGVATALPDGAVLVIGGPSADCDASSAERYDPAAGTFTSMASLNVARHRFAVTVLADGRLLVTGGIDQTGTPIANAEVYDGAAGTFQLAGTLQTPRYDHSAVRLRDGGVLAIGGRDGAGVLNAVEIYDPAADRFSTDAVLSAPRMSPLVAALADGGALVAGGRNIDAQALATAERYTRSPRSATSTTITSSLASSTYGQPVTYDATVTSGGGAPTGTVRFFDGAAVLGATTVDSTGRATLTISTTAAGTRAIKAVYSGSLDFDASESLPIQQVVAKATGSGTLTIAPLQRQYSDPVAFAATVSPATAAQRVTFRVSTTVLGSADVVGGKATLTIPVPANMPVGSRIITAEFNQDVPNYTIGSVSKSMSILKEDARVTIYGYTAYTACRTCSVAKVILRADVDDISVTPDANGDTTPGDIRNATLTFINRTTYGNVATVPVTLEDPGVLTKGEAVYEWTVDLGTAQSKTFSIGYSVGGLYSRTTYESVAVTVSRPK